MAKKLATHDFDDDRQYRVKLSRPVEFRGIMFRPDHNPVMKGSFIRLIQADPKNEGAIDDYAEVTQ